MVPTALIILDMISVLPLPLVVRLWDDLGERQACFVPSVTEPVDFNAPGNKIEIQIPEVGAVSVSSSSRSSWI
ncbi:hypothetical protein PR002_g31445 [Phytophthora rubi]|uniref:Rab-GAP TBC domain-containing protein n=1 Tax=Phytophthora rubi TaxID=129364 RepID=A0A6A3GIL1_9STRA|nr:hypothetical protein PR002_g31445 [Phytophthora rubi]